MRTKKPEQALWSYVARVMGNRWRAQRHEDEFQPDVPDVSFVCGGIDGWVELKVVPQWPQREHALYMPRFTPGQRAWLVARGSRGSGSCWCFVKVENDYVLMHWSQFDRIGQWTRDEWLWGAAGFWQGRLNPDQMAYRLGKP